jgi:hypothetical protein
MSINVPLMQCRISIATDLCCKLRSLLFQVKQTSSKFSAYSPVVVETAVKKKLKVSYMLRCEMPST